MPSCSIPSCKNNSNNCKGTGIKFHRFSKNPQILNAWKNAFGGKEIKLEAARICSVHFKKRSYVRKPEHLILEGDTDIYILDKNAVPTENLSTNSPSRIDVKYTDVKSDNLEVNQLPELEPFVFVKQELNDEFNSVKIEEPEISALEGTLLQESDVIVDSEIITENDIKPRENFSGHSYPPSIMCEEDEDFGNTYIGNLDDLHVKEEKIITEKSQVDHKDRERSEDDVKIKPVRPKPKNFKCDLCNFRAAHKSHLKIHTEKVHLKLNNYKCDMCNFKSVHKSNVKVHKETVHLKLKKYECRFCDFSSCTKSNIGRHTNSVHLNLKKYKCDFCDLETAEFHAMKVHISSVHLKLKNYKCDSCSYESAVNNNLKEHINSVHLKLKKFQCHLCDFICSLKSNLTLHVDAVHLKKRQHQCPSCDYKVSRKSDLNRHVKSVHLRIEGKTLC